MYVCLSWAVVFPCGMRHDDDDAMDEIRTTYIHIQTGKMDALHCVDSSSDCEKRK